MLEVQKKKCDQCLFSAERIVSKERAAEIIRGCLDSDQYFICHKGTIKQKEAELRGEDPRDIPDLVCAGFREAYPRVGRMLRFADWIGAIKEVEVK